jgi:hypothetical protein
MRPVPLLDYRRLQNQCLCRWLRHLYECLKLHSNNLLHRQIRRHCHYWRAARHRRRHLSMWQCPCH